MSCEPIFSRRSIRKFRSGNVPDNILRRIIEAGICAPSAKNRQPWKCIVFRGASKDELLDHMEFGINREENVCPLLPESRSGIPDARHTLDIMRQAPVVIMVLNTDGRNPFMSIEADERFTELNDTLSIGAFIENMLLEAESLGIGSLWVGNTCFAYSELTAYMETKEQLIGAVALGYADEAPTQRPRIPFESIVEFRN